MNSIIDKFHKKLLLDWAIWHLGGKTQEPWEVHLGQCLLYTKPFAILEDISFVLKNIQVTEEK